MPLRKQILQLTDEILSYISHSYLSVVNNYGRVGIAKKIPTAPTRNPGPLSCKVNRFFFSLRSVQKNSVVCVFTCIKYLCLFISG
jgi:hypothetical protein